MSAWNDRDRWAALCSGAACPICSRREPLDLVAKLEACWVTMQEAAPVPGYVCLVSESHAVELHDLPEEGAAAFMRAARRVSRALAAATGAVKLNYEIHGNSLPHLHMHLFPRYRGDQFARFRPLCWLPQKMDSFTCRNFFGSFRKSPRSRRRSAVAPVRLS